ncbi:MAG: sulfotransferase [Congregibacter sp.]
MIHIVGLYKCGTSWLLHMLAAHPEVVAWREFDPVALSYEPGHRLHQLPRLAQDYLRRTPDNPHWLQRLEAATPRKPDAIFDEMFLGHGWIPLLGADQQRRAQNLRALGTPEILDGLLKLGGLTLRESTAKPLSSIEATRTLGVQSFRRCALQQLMDQVRTLDDASRLPTLFFDSLRGEVEDSAVIACKAADQLMHLGALLKACPNAKAIAIIRDGRDAAVSAYHYEQLMREQEAPWRVPKTSRLRRLLGWSVRAAKLAEHARRKDVLVVRYEDLKQHFEPTCASVFAALGLCSEPGIITQVKSATEFKAESAGREPGEPANHIVRKGLVGEWREVFSPLEANLAWTMIGKELEVFGYRADGSLAASELLIGHE